MALKGKTVREQIWNYLKSKGLSNHGTVDLLVQEGEAAQFREVTKLLCR